VVTVVKGVVGDAVAASACSPEPRSGGPILGGARIRLAGIIGIGPGLCELQRIHLLGNWVNMLLDDVPPSRSDHHHRAWCVPDDRVRDAAHHYQTDP
jgi:hypothetical protein